MSKPKRKPKESLRKRVPKLLKRVGLVVAASLALLFINVKGPQYHASYIRDKVGSKVVKIYGERSGGTGFHIKAASGATYIATNGHICLLADENDTVLVKHGRRSMRRRVIQRHPNHDLCLVEALPGVEGLSIGSYPSLGEVVALVGHPGLRPLSLARGEIIGERRITLVFGIDIPKSWCIGEYFTVDEITKKGKRVTEEEVGILFYLLMRRADSMCLASNLRSKMLNGISYGGNSGSPMVDFWGNVTGVLYAGGRQVTDSYVVPLYYLKTMLEDF